MKLDLTMASVPLVAGVALWPDFRHPDALSEFVEIWTVSESLVAGSVRCLGVAWRARENCVFPRAPL